MHDLGWEHKNLLDEGIEGPVDRSDVDAPVVVSSGEDEDLTS